MKLNSIATVLVKQNNETTISLRKEGAKRGHRGRSFTYRMIGHVTRTKSDDKLARWTNYFVSSQPLPNSVQNDRRMNIIRGCDIPLYMRIDNERNMRR